MSKKCEHEIRGPASLGMASERKKPAGPLPAVQCQGMVRLRSRVARQKMSEGWSPASAARARLRLGRVKLAKLNWA